VRVTKGTLTSKYKYFTSANAQNILALLKSTLKPNVTVVERSNFHPAKKEGEKKLLDLVCYRAE